MRYLAFVEILSACALAVVVFYSVVATCAFVASAIILRRDRRRPR